MFRCSAPKTVLNAEISTVALLSCITAPCLFAMAPKQSKLSSAASSSGGYADDNAGAQPPADTTNDLAIANLLQAMEDMVLDDVSKDDMLKVVDGLKSMKKRWSEIEKEKKKLSPEEKEALKKERAENKKVEKKNIRETMVTFNVRLGSMAVEVRVALSITAGALRRKVADLLNLSNKAAKTLTLELDGVLLTSAPRKTLSGGFNVRGGGTINATVYGRSDVVDASEAASPENNENNENNEGIETSDEEIDEEIDNDIDNSEENE